jgi:hypothetical protein
MKLSTLTLVFAIFSSSAFAKVDPDAKVLNSTDCTIRVEGATKKQEKVLNEILTNKGYVVDQHGNTELRLTIINNIKEYSVLQLESRAQTVLGEIMEEVLFQAVIVSSYIIPDYFSRLYIQNSSNNNIVDAIVSKVDESKKFSEESMKKVIPVCKAIE